MCIICLEFQKSRDLVDAKRMLAAARKEPKAIDPKHLDQVERELKDAESKQAKNP